MGSTNESTIQTIFALHQESNSDGILIEMARIAASGTEKEKLALKSLLWPIPTETDFDILIGFMDSMQISNNIYSIGCGTGLLEYLLLEFLNKRSTGKQIYSITGIEVDSLWWRSKHAPPLFLPVLYVGENFSSDETFGEGNTIALFSYFNSMTVFAQYLRAFQGNYIAIIGPLQSDDTKKITQFCAPNPLDLRDNPELPNSKWSLSFLKRFGLTEVDYIGVYTRN